MGGVTSINSESFVIYEKNGKYLILNPKVPSWIVTNINGALLLKLYDGVRSFSEIAEIFCKQIKIDMKDNVLRFLSKAEDARLFQEHTEMPVHKAYKFSSIYLNMTEICNLHCVYCYASSRVESGNRLTLNDYIRVLDEVAKMTDEMRITFTGGEPLMSELTFPVAHYAKSKGFETYLLSNGTLINKKNIKPLLECFDHFKISMDGSRKEIHEYFRGKGTFEPTVAAVKLLQSLGADVAVPMVVTKRNISDIPAMSDKWGRMVTFQPLFRLGNAEEATDLSITGTEYYEALKSEGRINPYADIAGIIKAHAANRTIFKCAMGDGEISISCSGDVYPCQLLHFPEFLIANVKEGSLKEIYYSKKMERFKYHTVNNIKGCKTCELKYLCGGACQARHYSETGTIDEVGAFCEYEKKGIVNGILDNYEMKAL